MEHIAQVFVYIPERQVSIILAIQENSAFCRLIEPAGQIDKGCLSRPGLPDEGNGLPRADGQVEAAKNSLTVLIGEMYIFKGNAAM